MSLDYLESTDCEECGCYNCEKYICIDCHKRIVAEKVRNMHKED
jgi:hypothetical protein